MCFDCMRHMNHIIKIVPAAVALLWCSSCADSYSSDGDAPGPQESATIHVNTLSVGSSRSVVKDGSDNSFALLFWHDTEHLDPASRVYEVWPAPYLAVHAPRPVVYYKNSVFDTNHPYPAPSDKYIYATGYSPADVLQPDPQLGYEKLISQVGSLEKGRYDFMGCDVWREVYKGSLKDPFAQDKNKLYFRHLAAKLVFFADRDRASMENKQFVRNVEIKNLYMSIEDGDDNWISMCTPAEFGWRVLNRSNGDIAGSYLKAITDTWGITGNESAVNTYPKAGYKATAAQYFAGGDSNFVLSRGNTDRLPVDGAYIDSCYVCNPIDAEGNVKVSKRIRLKMDISAELSFDRNFPKPDGESATDDMTFTRVWHVELPAIYKVNEAGQVLTEPVSEFKPGNEYRVYIHFHRTGVYLVARELPWNKGGVHYITISGGDITQSGT